MIAGLALAIEPFNMTPPFLVGRFRGCSGSRLTLTDRAGILAANRQRPPRFDTGARGLGTCFPYITRNVARLSLVRAFLPAACVSLLVYLREGGPLRGLYDAGDLACLPGTGETVAHRPRTPLPSPLGLETVRGRLFAWYTWA